jgi:S1-C subfamily serine protease
VSAGAGPVLGRRRACARPAPAGRVVVGPADNSAVQALGNLPGVPDDPSEFDDEAELVGNPGAPLPPDDRLWRHPSELGAGLARRQAALVAAAPSRPGSVSAALAGALLAAGIVLVATHFAVAFGGASANKADGNAVGNPLDTVTVSTVKNAFNLNLAGNSATGISPSLEALVNRVDASTVLVQATRGSAVMQVAGIVVGATCLVIAPASIVEDNESIDMTLPDGKLVEAQVVGVDRATGIAVLRCDESGLPAVRDDDEPTTTDEMVALVGASREPTAPYVGIVISIDQRVVLGDGTRLMDELETDVPPVQDGEAVVGGDGDVLGVVVGESNGDSIATPMWLALAVARQIVASGKAGHAWLGIAGGSVTSHDQPAGVRVMAVVSGSAAARAGIRAGDVIDSVDGQRTDSMTTLEAQLYCLRPGTVASIGLVRDDRDLVEKATLAAAPAA